MTHTPAIVMVFLLVYRVSADRWVLGREGEVIITHFVDRLAIADRLDRADERNVGDFLEMIVTWTRGKNVLREEDCMVLNFG